MPKGGRTWFFDTVTLCNFALAGRLDILIAQYGRRAQVTPEVLDEVSEGIAAGHVALREIEDAIAGGKLGMAPPMSFPERVTYRNLLRCLSPGESSCIACAKKRGRIVVTDDRAARGCCTDLGISFTGTIGILKTCCQEGILTGHNADDLLTKMIAAGYHSPVTRVSDIL